ncbi:MAG TPA: hypothetical protein VJ485_00145 [archaeon]|nr:hypothetical protein [archaeon]
MKYPESVLTKNRKGETEVRLLIDKGKFTRYTYVYPDGTKAEGGKVSIILTNETDQRTHYFLIPTQGGRYLAIIPKETTGKKATGESPSVKVRKVWNGKGEVEV